MICLKILKFYRYKLLCISSLFSLFIFGKIIKLNRYAKCTGYKANLFKFFFAMNG